MTDVLCVGLDDAAMLTRRLMLEQAGHSVTQTRDLRQVKAACESDTFSVVILGQWINASEKKRITDVVLRFCKQTKILELHAGLAPQLAEADAHLQITASAPESLVEAVNRLIKPRRNAKVRPAV